MYAEIVLSFKSGKFKEATKLLSDVVKEPMYPESRRFWPMNSWFHPKDVGSGRREFDLEDDYSRDYIYIGNVRYGCFVAIPVFQEMV